MRLLHTTTIILSSFDDDDSIPPYAILSHTWGDAETSSHDMSKNVESELKQSEGYLKVHSCCALAALQGHEYVWIDTCCIDKTSSAELSEAINSMYRWYEKAQVCYAYLADVCTGEQGYWSPNVRRQFQESRWFTRGWTLQELLAPWHVVFYDKDWREFGSRRILREQISLVTGIQVGHLFNMNDASAAQKMSWASGRKTRRVEDMAYSLMGIFDVNMQLLYGEGEKAFMRLQHEIIKITDDESIFAWTDYDLAKSAPYAVTNRGFAIETFAVGFADKGNPAEFMARQDIRFVPLNCRRQSEAAEASAERLVIDVEKLDRGVFVRSSPGQLRPAMWKINLSFMSLVYVRPVYTYKHYQRQYSVFINTSSLLRRGLSILDTYDCQAKRHHWGFWRFTLGKGVNVAAVLLNGSRDDNPQRLGIIFHAAEDTLSINLMTPSSAQTFQEEMDKYKYGPKDRFPSAPSVGPISLMLQDNRWVAIKLEGQRSTPFEERYFVEFERPCEEDRVYI